MKYVKIQRIQVLSNQYVLAITDGKHSFIQYLLET
jgi:hypothetical protein